MIDEQLRVDAEHAIQQVFIVIIRSLSQRTAGDISHGIQSFFLQLFRVTRSYPPEICQRPVGPEQPPVRQFIQLGDAHAVLIRRHMLGPDIHRHLADIQIRPDSCCRRDPRSVQHIQNHLHSQLPGRHPIGFQISSRVDKYLVNGIDMHIFRRNIFQINFINPGADLHVARHLRRRDHIVHRQRRVCLQLPALTGRTLQYAAGRLLPALRVDLPDLLHHFKEPGPPGDAVSLQSRRNCQTNGLFRSALICHHQICGHRVQPPFHTLHGGVKGF